MPGPSALLNLFLVSRVRLVAHEWLHASLSNLWEAIAHSVSETRFQDALEAMGRQGVWPAALSTPSKKSYHGVVPGSFGLVQTSCAHAPGARGSEAT